MADTDQVLNLAAIIREVDGTHSKGAAALAESILDHPRFRAVVAAALRAAADQLAQTPIVIGEPLRGNIAKDAAVIHVADLLAIAAELKTSND